MQPAYSDSKKTPAPTSRAAAAGTTPQPKLKSDETAKKNLAKKEDSKNEATQKPLEKHSNKRKTTTGIVTLIVGIAVLAAGLVLLLLNVLSKPAVRDADYLVEIGTWEREDAPGVIWNFTEIGKGTLTTNNHVNDYDFIWAIEGDKLKIETNWLYTLDNDYSYDLKQGDEAMLTLKSGEGEELIDINFHPASSVDTEITEDN